MEGGQSARLFLASPFIDNAMPGPRQRAAKRHWVIILKPAPRHPEASTTSP
jgi:hypothetical protein